MRGWTRFVGPAGPLVLLAGAAGAAQAAEREPPALETAFLEFLAEEAGVDEELSDALMSADLDRALEESSRRSKVNDDVKD